MTNTVRQPSVTVTVDGTPITDVLAVSVRHGFDQGVAQATIEVRALPGGIVPWSVIVITLGANAGTAAQRFSGYYVSADYNLYPHTVTLNCRGNLYRAESYQCDQISGVDISSAGTGATDAVMVTTILYICGLAAAPSPAAAGIGGTVRTLGTIANGKGFNWDLGQSGLEFIHQLDSVCLGYRTFDKPDGTIVREEILPTPAVTADYTYTEHVDIFRATNADTMMEASNRVIVTGYSPGKDKIQHQEEAANPWLIFGGVQNYHTHQLSSNMIEKALTADAGDGLSCEEVAAWLLADRNVRRLRCQFTTPRDDGVEPGDTIEVDAPTRLGLTNQLFWVQSVEVRVDNSGAFSQTLTCLSNVAVPA